MQSLKFLERRLIFRSVDITAARSINDLGWCTR